MDNMRLGSMEPRVSQILSSKVDGLRETLLSIYAQRSLQLQQSIRSGEREACGELLRQDPSALFVVP